MSLRSKLNEITEELEEKGVEVEQTEAEAEEPADNAAPEAEPEGKEPAAKEEKPAKTDKAAKDQPKVEDDEPPADKTAWARLRQEKAEAERESKAALKRAEDAEARAAAAAQPKTPAKPAHIDAEPDKDTDPEAHLRWELRQAKAQLQDLTTWRAEQEKTAQRDNTLKAAREEFSTHEENFKKLTPDYEQVAEFAVNAIAHSIRTLNPSMNGKQLGEAVELQILRMAGQAQKAGHDPVEYLYHQAKNWGYKPKEEPAADPEKKPLKPSLQKIVDSKKRTASSATPGGKTAKTAISRDSMKGASLAEWSRLTPAELKELESMEGAE